MPITVKDIRTAVLLEMPLLEMISSRTINKYDDIAVVTLRVIATNDDIAKAIEDAIGKIPKMDLPPALR